MSLNDISPKFTENTLDEIIKLEGGIKHTKWDFSGGFKKGDSYLSEVFRLHIYGIDSNDKKIEVQTVIKALPKNIGRRKTFRSADFFRNEYNFYTKVIPIFMKFQSEKKLSNPFNEFAKFYAGVCDGKNDFIALEDLSQYGYRTAARQNGLDYLHCSKIMQTFGRFHALSFAIRDQNPELFKVLTNSVEETYYAENFRKWYEPFLKDQIIVAKDAVSKEYSGTDIEMKMKKFTGNQNHFYDTMISLTHFINQYSVIGHGDGWTPNFLMTYDDASIAKTVKVIDFQLARYASPAIDLSFFIYSCTTRDMRERHYDNLIRDYYNSLSSFVKDFGSNPEILFPFSALEEELKMAARFGVGMAMESLPLSIMDDSETSDLDLIEGDDPVPLTNVWIVRPIETKEGRLRIADCFKHAVERKYLD